jgi:hypothetical protein
VAQVPQSMPKLALGRGEAVSEDGMGKGLCGMVHAHVDQNLLKNYKLRDFSMTNFEFSTLHLGNMMIY